MSTSDNATPNRAELAQELFDLLHAELLRGMRARTRPHVDFLKVTRAFLADQGIGIGPQTAEDRKQLHALHRLYVKRLREALEAPDVRATVLVEASRFLIQNGITPSEAAMSRQDNGREAARPPRGLPAAALPFKLPGSGKGPMQ